MKRLVFLTAAALLGTSTAALAADCDASPVESGSTVTYFLAGALDITSPGSANCSIGPKLPSAAANRYVIYQTDIRGSALVLDDDSSTSISRTALGETRTKTYSGETDEEFIIRDRYAAGLGPTPGFSGDYETLLDGDGGIFVDEITLTMAWTTKDEQVDSFTELGQQQNALVTHLDGMTSLLTGGNLALEGDNEAGVIGGLGSYMLGGTFRANLAQGFSLLGGASIVDLSVPGASANGFNGALAVRYVEPAGAAMRMFGEAGVHAGALNVSLSRAYYDSQTFSDDYDATGTGTGFLGAAYIKGGVVIEPMADNEVVISASLKQSGLFIDSFIEDDPDANANLFQANLSGSASSFTTVKTGADWTTKLTDDVDLTASAAVGATFGSGVTGDVFGVGEVTGEATSTIFAQYGLRLGWQPTEASQLDGFIQGSTGTGIGTHAQIGAAYRMKF